MEAIRASTCLSRMFRQGCEDGSRRSLARSLLFVRFGWGAGILSLVSTLSMYYFEQARIGYRHEKHRP